MADFRKTAFGGNSYHGNVILPTTKNIDKYGDGKIHFWAENENEDTLHFSYIEDDGDVYCYNYKEVIIDEKIGGSKIYVTKDTKFDSKFDVLYTEIKGYNFSVPYKSFNMEVPYSIFNEVIKDKELLKRFEKIEPYFKDLTKEDLEQQDIYDYIDYAEPHLKMLMKVFVEKYLEPYLYGFTVPKEVVPKLSENIFNGNCIYLKNKLKYSTSLSIKDYLFSLNCKINNVSFIDFSENDISSTYVKYITMFLDRISNKLSNGITVLLNNNRIHGIQGTENEVISNIKIILDMPQVKFLVLTGNPFVSMDQKTFFMNINVDQAKKLILFDWSDIRTNRIPKFFCSEEMDDIVLETHRYYYLKNNSNYYLKK